MAKKKKLTAKQKRERRDRERDDRKAYEEGRRGPSRPKSTRKRQKMKEEQRLKQKEAYNKENPSQRDIMKMEKQLLKEHLYNKLLQAWNKYFNLISQGIKNAATAIYETDLLGQINDLDNMDLNTMRALLKVVNKWLQRKDVNMKRAKKNWNKAKQKFGFDNADEASNYWDMFKKWLESSDAAKGTPGSPKKVEAFKEAYQRWKASGSDDMQELFDLADKSLRDDYEPIDPFDFPGEDDLF